MGDTAIAELQVKPTTVIVAVKSNDTVVHYTPPPPTPEGFTLGSVTSIPSSRLHLTERRPTAYGLPAIQPPVTEQAVRLHLAQLAGVPGIQSQQPSVITSIAFITIEELDKQFGYQLLPYYLPTDQVVYVSFSGKFQMDAVSYKQAYTVFDAKTGNFLASSLK